MWILRNIKRSSLMLVLLVSVVFATLVTYLAFETWTATVITPFEFETQIWSDEFVTVLDASNATVARGGYIFMNTSAYSNNGGSVDLDCIITCSTDTETIDDGEIIVRSKESLGGTWEDFPMVITEGTQAATIYIGDLSSSNPNDLRYFAIYLHPQSDAASLTCTSTYLEHS